MITEPSPDSRCWLDHDHEISEDGLISQGDTTRMNGNTFSVFVSMACINGDFSQEESIIWQWTRNDHCASAFIGGSVPVFSYPANDYLRNFHKELLNNNNYRLGHLNLTANLLGLSAGNQAIDNAFCFICAGDPSLELWTGAQSEFGTPVLSISDNTLVISTNGICDFSVNIASSDGMLLGKYHSSGSSLTIPLPNSDCDIAIDKHNYVPYIIHYGSQYIQNETIMGRALYSGTPIQIGYDVTNSKAYGNVVVEPDSKVTIYNGNGGVLIKNGFECKQGASLEIK